MNQRLRKSAQDRQDAIFRKMSADRKLATAARLSVFCLELNSLNHHAARNSRSPKGSGTGRGQIRQGIYQKMGKTFGGWGFIEVRLE